MDDYKRARLLDQVEWPRLKAIMSTEFQNGMPVNPAQSAFDVIETSAGEIAAFVHIETVFNLNAFYVAPEHRHQNRLLVELMRDVDARLKASTDFPVIAMLDANDTENKVARMLSRLGGRDLGVCRVLRRDG